LRLRRDRRSPHPRGRRIFPLQIRKRLAGIGRTPENLTAIFITHEHSDHISGLLGIADKFQIPVYCNRGTQDGAVWTFKTKWASKKKLPLENRRHLETEN
jgi:phosphoribosyl 1,2-cyclic phosphodiesterase